MNANELADNLENSIFDIQDDGTTVGVDKKAVYKAATMLRQLQAENEALKKNLDVALMVINSNPVKELTDEEIIRLVVNCFGKSAYDNYFVGQWIDFARAILRKAQEKI